MQVMGLYPANSIFIGDYLTTPGAAEQADLHMIRDAGFVLESPDGEPLSENAFADVPAFAPGETMRAAAPPAPCR
jgi:biotin synthase